MRQLVKDSKGRLFMVASIDNRLYRVEIAEYTSAMDVYSYFAMNDEDFKKLCKLFKKASR